MKDLTLGDEQEGMLMSLFDSLSTLPGKMSGVNERS